MPCVTNAQHPARHMASVVRNTEAEFSSSKNETNAKGGYFVLAPSLVHAAVRSSTSLTLKSGIPEVVSLWPATFNVWILLFVIKFTIKTTWLPLDFKSSLEGRRMLQCE